MISLKKYLDSTSAAPVSPPAAERRNAPAREKAKGSMLALKNARPWLRRIHRHAPPTHHSDWEVGWASAEAQMRGMGVKWIDEQGEKPKFPTYKPGLIDI